LVKLENLQGLSKDEQEKYQELAISVFTQREPKNESEAMVKCPGKNCDSKISEL
jgi:hypothetical protein